MLEKIKSVARTFFHGSFASLSGFIGACLILLSLYFCLGLFTGTANIQNYFKNRSALGRVDARISALESALETENRHIRLIEEQSPDFISEMALKHLNLGDPEIMILKK